MNDRMAELQADWTPGEWPDDAAGTGAEFSNPAFVEGSAFDDAELAGPQVSSDEDTTDHISVVVTVSLDRGDESHTLSVSQHSKVQELRAMIGRCAGVHADGFQLKALDVDDWGIDFSNEFESLTSLGVHNKMQLIATGATLSTSSPPSTPPRIGGGHDDIENAGYTRVSSTGSTGVNFPGDCTPPSRQRTGGVGVSTGVGTSTGGSWVSNWNKKADCGFVGLSNQGATCYLNSLLQSLFMTYELRKGLYQWEYDDQKYEALEECVPAQLQRLFVNLQTSEERAVETTALTAAFGWTDADAFEQQDVNELLVILYDALEQKFKGTPQAGLIKALYSGEYDDCVICKCCGNKAGAGASGFTSLDLAISEFGSTEKIGSIQEGLRQYFKSEILDGDNQYHCEKCEEDGRGPKQDAEKGLKLSKVPYILSIGLKRFDYDWERDCRIKVDDEVIFPDVLDMAEFLDMEPAPAPEPESAPALQPETSSSGEVVEVGAGVEEGTPPVEHCGFGKDGAEIRAADVETARANGKLEYELFAVLIHSGSAIGGHYYCYCRDGEGSWYEFNDASISEIDEEEVGKAYGGTTTNRRGGYSWSYASSASAYMLMYRRKDDALNINAVEKDDLPARLSEEIAAAAAKEAEARAEEAAENERRRTLLEYNKAYSDNRAADVDIPKTSTLSETVTLLRAELAVPEDIAEDDVRLLKWNHYEARHVPVDFYSDTPISKCEIGYNTDLVLETRAAGDGWPEMLEIGSGISATTYDRQYVVRMALFDSSAGQLDERGWTDIVLRLGTTVGDLRAAANELYGLDSENLILVKVDVHAVEEFLMPDDTSVRNSRPGIYSNGSLIVARDTRLEGGKSQVAALKAALSEESTESQVFFSEVGGSTYAHKLVVSSSISVSALTAQVAAVLGKPSDEIKLYDDNRELYGYSLDRRVALLVKAVERGGASHQVPIHAFNGDRDGGEYLLDMTVQEDIMITEFKQKLADRLREDGPEAFRECTGEHLRVRECGYSVFMDDQTVIEAVKNFAGGERFAVSIIDGPETKTDSSQGVLSLMRWNPSTFTVTEEPLEVVCESSTTFDELRILIANAVQLGDDEHGSTDIAHIGVTKRGWRMDSVLDVPGLAWDADREDPDKMDAYGRAATSDIGFISDGDVFLYQDNREELKELTEEERKKLKTESRAKAKVGASQETVRMKYLRQNDTGVKIKIAQGPSTPKGEGSSEATVPAMTAN